MDYKFIHLFQYFSIRFEPAFTKIIFGINTDHICYNKKCLQIISMTHSCKWPEWKTFNSHKRKAQGIHKSKLSPNLLKK